VLRIVVQRFNDRLTGQATNAGGSTALLRCPAPVRLPNRLNETSVQPPIPVPAMLERIQMVLGGLFIVLFTLSRLGRRFPDVLWLRPFHNLLPQLPEAQRAKMRRRQNVHAGVELILLGVGLPLAYGAVTMMTFSSFTTLGVSLVLIAAVVCIGLGVTAIWRRNRD
jgi:hypothetical protein